MNIFRKSLLSTLAALMLPAGMGAETLFTCGDSTMADYATDGSTPTRGWGQYFGAFFSPDITVINRGKGGMDVQGFYYGDAYWPAIKKILKPGDYVLLQFAHNDEKNGGMDGRQLRDYYLGIGDTQAAASVDIRGSIPHDTYAATLRTLVAEIRALGATPILASSICRMNFTADGDIRRAARHDLGDNFEVLTPQGPTKGNSVPADDHSMDFRRQMEMVADDLDVDFIDLTEATRELFTSYGQAKTAEIISDGQGGTHLSTAGAALIARRCAEMMVEQGILADKINVGDADITLSPADGNLGEAYTGNILSKEFTLTGFGLSPESGSVTISAESPFEVSADKSRWSQSASLAYDGGTLIGSFYVRATLTNPGELTGTVTATAGSSSASVNVSATALPIPGSGAMSLNWPLVSDDDYVLSGEAVPVAMSLHGLRADGYDGGLRLVPEAGSWPAGDIDESPERYIEFGVTAPEGKTLAVDRMALSVGSPDLDIMQCHVSYSAEPGFGNPRTFSMPAGTVTDRSGNPAPAVELSFTTMERLQPEARTYDAIVDIDGNGDYTSVQAAIDAAPAGRVKPWLIFVQNGRYKEHVDIPASKPFIHIIGQDRDKTVICDDRLCGGDNAVHVSVGATVVVNSDDCFFENITLENTYGHEQQSGPQAVALNTSGDRTIFNNVAMLSYQDTWITPGKSAYRAYVKNSLIEGAVDFIYNSGDIYVENTTLLITRNSGGFIVAPSHAADVAWGYVFRDCTITAPGDPSQTTVWLGRPWHNFPKTVFLNTRAEVNIPPTGWYETMGGLPAIWADWNTTDADGNLLDLSQRRDTYYYMQDGERVYGTAKNRLTDEEAATYTLHNVLSGADAWQPAIKTEACDAPAAVLDGTMLAWQAVPYAICYVVTDGDKVVAVTTDTEAEVADGSQPETLAVQAVNEFGGLSVRGSVKAGQGIADTADIEEFTLTGICDIHGRTLAAPAPGVNILRYTTPSGRTRVEKVVIH